MRRLLVTVAIMSLILSLQIGISYALGGTGPDVTIPTLTVKPGTVTNLVIRSIRGLSQLQKVSTTIDVGSNAACSGGGSRSWDEGFGIQWQYRTDGTKLSYHTATATHYCGAASYEHEAHGTLIHGWDYGGDQVWSRFNNPCDEVVKDNNPEVATCSSPDFDTHHGDKWYVISGQYFDQDFNSNGNKTWPCYGCMDTQWSVP